MAMPHNEPDRLNMAEYFLEARLREGKGERTALLTDRRAWTYREVDELANRFGHVLRAAGVEPEQRVLLALPDGPELVAALFGTLKLGAVVVMVNPELAPDALVYFLEYTRAVALVVERGHVEAFEAAAEGARHRLKEVLVVGEGDLAQRLRAASPQLDCFPTHRDDAALWLFSGGTTGRPKAVVQPHRSFVNTAECYGKGVIGYREDDVTLSVPKLFFGYATGSNLLFPFSVGARAVLFPERCTPERLFEQIARHRPTILVNVPTMVHKMVGHAEARAQDLSCLRLATSAGEALPVPLYERWRDAFGVELLDGLGTAEMWHIFVSNRPGAVRPGTLGAAVPGFDVGVCDDAGHALPDGEVGWLRVRGGSRGLGYWQQLDQTARTFRGEWVVTGDMVRRTLDGTFTYCGRGDDMLKVAGKWVAPEEVESCLLTHPGVKEVAVVGIADGAGLVRPHAFVVAAELPPTGEELQGHVRARLEPHKAPREVHFVGELPRTHLGKVDRGKLRAWAT
jgi:benzoate-CoA ligase family protein